MPHFLKSLVDGVPMTRLLGWLGALILATGVLLIFDIPGLVLAGALLRAEDPSRESAWELFDEAGDPSPLLERFWQSEKIPHRLLVLEYLVHKGSLPLAWQRDLDPLLFEAAHDPDLEVRAAAQQILTQQKSPGLLPILLRQLWEPDAAARLLALEMLRKSHSQSLVPDVARLSDDCDVRVAATAVSLIQRWTRQDFGLRMHLTITSKNTGEIPGPRFALLNDCLQRWRQWWERHCSEYPMPAMPARRTAFWPKRLPAPSYAAVDLDGKQVRPGDFAGKPVLLAFFSISTPEGLQEARALAQLQLKTAGRLAMVCFCVDGLPDACFDDHAEYSSEHTHSDHHDHSEHNGHDHGLQPTIPESSELIPITAPPTPAEIAQLAQKAGVRFPIVHDRTGAVARRYAAIRGPTKVLLDKDGRIQRRWIELGGFCGLEQMIQK